MKKLLLGALISLLLTACAATCYDNQNSIPKAGFYSASSGQAVTITGLAIGGVDAPGDSLLCSPSESQSFVFLPFRPADGETEFQVSANGLSDVITFWYDSTPYFASAECGAIWRYRIRNVEWTRNLIDSVAIVDSIITNVDSEQIKLILKVKE